MFPLKETVFIIRHDLDGGQYFQVNMPFSQEEETNEF